MVSILNLILLIFQTFFNADFLKQVAALFACLALIVAVTGCAPNTEPIERTATQGFAIVNQALQKALAETSTRTGTLQGTMTGVEPGWIVEGYGIFGTGLVYQGKIYVKGASGTLTGHIQTDQGEQLPDKRDPGDRNPPAAASTTPDVKTTEGAKPAP